MASRTVTSALAAALRKAQPQPADAAAVALATRYATAIDTDPDALAKLGPQLLAVLTALGMTPAARAAVAKGGTSGPASSPLDELRARRDARQHRAAAVDPAAG